MQRRDAKRGLAALCIGGGRACRSPSVIDAEIQNFIEPQETFQ